MRRSLRLIWLGIAAELRGPGIRMLGVLGFLAATAWSWDQRATPGTTALVLSLWFGRMYGVAAGLWFAYTGLRDQNDQLGAVIRTKPITGSEWNGILWISGTLLWLFLLATAFVGAAGAAAVGGSPATVGFLLAYGRAALVLVPMSTLCFGFSRLMRSPLGGILTVFAWFCAFAGFDYIPGFLKPDYSQNSMLLVFGSLTVFGFVALGVERFRRGELRVARDWAPIPVVVGAMAGITAVAAHGTLANTGDVLADHSELWQAVVRQDLQVGERLPGFWMTDQHGKLVRTAEYRGKILLFYLFSTQDTDSATNLRSLNAIQHEFGARGVQPVAVCLSEDRSDPTILARSSDFDFPLLADPTTVRLTPPHSVLATASRAENLPLLAITDRRLIVRSSFNGASADPAALRQTVQERLAEEPE